MAIRNRMNHVAAGLLASFCARGNAVDGYWALGMLYQEVQSAPHRVTLDLLAQTANPPGNNAALIAARYAGYLGRALVKQNVPLQELNEAMVTLQFKADITLDYVPPYWMGDLFACTVTLRGAGHEARYDAYGKCLPNDPHLFRQGGQR